MISYIKRFRLVAGYATLLAGLIALGRHFFATGGATDKLLAISVAVSFLLSGAIILLHTFNETNSTAIIKRLIPWAIVATGLFSFLGLDDGLPGTSFFNEMAASLPTDHAMNCAVLFIVTGLAWHLLNSGKLQSILLAQYIFHLVTGVCFVVLMCFVFYFPALHERPAFLSLPMVYSSLLFFIVAVAGSTVYAQLGITGILTGNKTGNIVARRLLPLLTFFLLVLGYLRLLIHKYHKLSIELGTTLLIISFLLVILMLIINTAQMLNRIDDKKNRTERNLFKAESNYKEIFDKADDGINIYEPHTWKIVDVNIRASEITGFTREELLHQNREQMTTNNPDFPRVKVISHLERAAAGQPQLFEWLGKKKDGTESWYEVNFKKATIGGKDRVLGFFRDISDRKLAELQVTASEKRLRYTMDNMLEGLQIISHDWRYLYVNAALTGQAKSSREQLLGRTMMECFPGIETTDAFRLYESCMSNRSSCHIENLFTFPDGTEGWFELSLQPVPEGIFILSMDVTERKKAQRQLIDLNKNLEKIVEQRTHQLAALNTELEANLDRLKDSEEKFSKIFETSPVGISIGSLPEGIIIDVNKSFLNMFGYSREEVIGHTSNELNMIDGHVREALKAEVMALGVIKEKEINAVRKSGEQFPALLSLDRFVMRGKHYAITISYDITERKLIEEQIRILYDDLEKNNLQLELVNKDLESFTYSVSHDLRAPLRAINGYATMLESRYQHALDGEGMRLLAVIQKNALRMGNLIDDLLAFSRLGRAPVKKTLVNMTELAESVWYEQTRNLEPPPAINMGELQEADADVSLVKQVLINLVSNAIKYSSKTEHPSIAITSAQRNDEIVYAVSDNGAGFDMQYSSKLFGVFERLHSASEFEGTGVGLAIVQRIVNRHGGRVWATGEVGKGATFYFSLPVNQA